MFCRFNKLNLTPFFLISALFLSISNKRFHVDTVDFYSVRSRSYLVRGLAELFGVEEKTISRDMEKLTLLTEEYTLQSAVDTAILTEIPAGLPAFVL